MAPAASDQHGNNQPAPPHQDQTDQSPTAQVEHTEQTEQPLEQEVSIAIVTPWWSTITLTAQEKADFEKASRLARYQPLPDPNEDDFADEPLPSPYDPNVDSRYEWAKPEAFIQEKDSEGNRYSRCSLSIINLVQGEKCGAIDLRRLLDTRDHGASQTRMKMAAPPSNITVLIPETAGQKEL